jgi:hypothetical protein
MRKSLVLTISLLGLGATRVGADPGLSDVSTWRWQVSAIQTEQKSAADQAVTKIGATRSIIVPQRYERFSPQGAVELEAAKP